MRQDHCAVTIAREILHDTLSVDLGQRCRDLTLKVGRWTSAFLLLSRLLDPRVCDARGTLHEAGGRFERCLILRAKRGAWGTDFGGDREARKEIYAELT